jgi:hypothetical protein
MVRLHFTVFGGIVFGQPSIATPSTSWRTSTALWSIRIHGWLDAGDTWP